MVNSKQKGFTLLELMIVMAVIAIVLIGALSSYRGFDQTKRLEADTEAFVEAVELAKKLVSSGEKPCVGYTGQYALNWGGSQFSVIPLGCSTIQSYILKGNEFQTATASAVFNPLGRGTSLNATRCVLIHNRYHNQCQKITIETSGTATAEQNPTCSCN
jgi:prepilin-type N-terminal cleavage/methylation domain-containing protein